jgi:heme-degrading monooxygenase HmoA
LKGSPKPAFYDGLLVKKGSYNLDYANDSGWRQIPADGVNPLPVDVFVVQKRIKVDDNKIQEFEDDIRSKDNIYTGSDGYAGSLYMRRDATKADDSYNYIEMSIWSSKAAYDSFKSTSTPLTTYSFNVDIKPAFYEGKLALNSIFGI